ncbi:EAL domain-containing protein [Galenea microaerophila]
MITKRTRLLKWLLLLLSAFLMAVILYFDRQTQQLEKQIQVHQTFFNLFEENAHLKQAELRLFKQQDFNYDTIRLHQAQLHTEVAQLKRELSGFPALNGKIQTFEKALQTQDSLLHHLIAASATYTNSFQALPQIIAECRQQTGVSASELDNLLSQLAVGAALKPLYQQAAKSPIAQHCPLLVQHLKILNQSSTTFQQSETLLSQLHLNQQIQQLYKDYAQQILTLLKRNQWITYFFFTLGALLLYLIWLFLIRIRKTNLELSHSLNALEKRTRLYHALSETNQAITQITDPHALFQKVTDNLHHFVKTDSCWIGEMDAKGALKPVAISGIGRTTILQQKIQLTGNYKQSHILADLVYQKDERVLIQDYIHQKRNSPYYQVIRQWGIRSMAIYPIHLEGKQFAMLFLFSTELAFFDPETDKLIQELVEDIELALHKMLLEQKQEALQRELKIAAITFESQEAIMITDGQQKIMRINHAAEKLFGFKQAELIGKTPRILLAKRDNCAQRFDKAMQQLKQSDVWEGDVWTCRKDKHPLFCKITISAVLNEQGDITHYIGHIIDRSFEMEAQNQIEHLKLYDPLTHLPNRDHLKTLLGKFKQTSLLGALFLINIAGFKRFNEALGTEAGDEILKQIALRLSALEKRTMAPLSLVSRISSDEFALFVAFASEAEREQAIFKLQESIKQLFKRPLFIHQEKLTLNYNMGITLLSANSHESATQWLRQADIALHQAKKNTKENVVFYESRMQDEVAKRHQTERQLADALHNEEFVMYYQPQIDLTTGRVVGAESLIRWQKSDGELVPPFKFISILESSDLMIPVGRWIIRHVIQSFSQALKQLDHPLRVAINLSGIQFNDEQLNDYILDTLETYHYSPEYLELEVTESVLMENLYSVQNTLKTLQNHGCKVAIDDFGTGYSSFNYLKQFSVNKLKIDKSFIDHIQQPKDAALVRAMAEMAHALGSIAIAEGVETEAQIEHLKMLNCDEVQGYYYSKPLPLEEFIYFVKQRNQLH